MNAIFAIAFGGAIGAVARYGVNVAAMRVFGLGFPTGTMIVNITGSFAMGILIAVFAQYWQPSETMRMFLITGILGAFTTFSTFSLDFVTLMERHDFIHAALYITGSVILSVTALLAGLYLIRMAAA